MRVAAIDLGSNSFHLLVTEITGRNAFRTVLREKMMIQIGKSALLTGTLDPEAMDRGLRCLEEFRRMALGRRVEKTLAVATSAIREARNGEEFLRRAREESGLSVHVINGREEARLIHLAVTHHLELGRRKALLVDIGGGSVELTVGNAARVHFSTSVKLGFLRLHGMFARAGFSTQGEIRALETHVRRTLAAAAPRIRRHSPDRVIATSGSATTLLRLAQLRRGGYAAARAQVSAGEIRALTGELLKTPPGERARRFDLDPLRAEFLPTALLCMSGILEAARADEITVSPVGLREGLIYDLMSHDEVADRIPEAAREAAGDLRLAAVTDLAGRCDYPAEHSRRVAGLAERIFRQTAALHGLDEEQGKLLRYAAILHDIGYHIGYAKHHKHAFYLVMSSGLRGFTPQERNILAAVVRYHRRASPKRSHPEFAVLPPADRRVVRRLAAILRIADGLDRSHFSLVEDVRCGVRDGKIEFQLKPRSPGADLALELWSGKSHARYFEKLFGVETEFVAGTGGPSPEARTHA